uniref:Uncharacterized protein n=1 Tax=Cyanoderma ruficeps TaxID=181631 RepID=A0A8C3R646_9PASS
PVLSPQERYSARDLQGLTVEHDPASIPEGQTLVLTLKDRGVLEGGEDVLEQVALAAVARAQEEQELRRRRPPYDPYGQEEPGPAPQVLSRHGAAYRDTSCGTTGCDSHVSQRITGCHDLCIMVYCGLPRPVYRNTPRAALPCISRHAMSYHGVSQAFTLLALTLCCVTVYRVTVRHVTGYRDILIEITMRRWISEHNERHRDVPLISRYSN